MDTPLVVDVGETLSTRSSGTRRAPHTAPTSMRTSGLRCGRSGNPTSSRASWIRSHPSRWRSARADRRTPARSSEPLIAYPPPRASDFFLCEDVRYNIYAMKEQIPLNFDAPNNGPLTQRNSSDELDSLSDDELLSRHRKLYGVQYGKIINRDTLLNHLRNPGLAHADIEKWSAERLSALEEKRDELKRRHTD